MLKETFKQLTISLKLLVIFSFITGLLYPAVATLLAQTFFPHKANGSLVEQDGKIVGSLLVGQAFSANKYFWGRPSATQPFPYNPKNFLSF